jgi:hypothetical protein
MVRAICQFYRYHGVNSRYMKKKPHVICEGAGDCSCKNLYIGNQFNG